MTKMPYDVTEDTLARRSWDGHIKDMTHSCVIRRKGPVPVEQKNSSPQNIFGLKVGPTG